MTDLIRMLFELRAGAFMDVGMNTGQTLLRVKAEYPDVHYVGFEPNATCVSYLKHLARINNFKNLVVVPVAISGNTGILGLSSFLSEDTDSSASIIADYRLGATVVRQDMIASFQFEVLSPVFDFSTVSIVKIDVEGAESFVLAELERLLTDSRPFVIVEILPVYTNENIDRLQRQEMIERLLGTIGYSLFRVMKNGAYGYTGLHELRSIGVHADISQCDYLLCPNEHRDDLLIQASRTV